MIEAVGAWPIPDGAERARRIQENLMAAVRGAFPDPQMVAYLAVGPLMVAMGRIEVELLDARRRIGELERALAERDS
ncbi:hypothetical protein IT779_19940 [Nocardia sp. NEAU-351]|uniref:Cell division protein ZapA n=1 Tax=Nocardia bovistercoris TaxID=2785916 RepID=A0A931IEY5_9NOCA|nr:hypothetical protein [Nocardia bovistercoris]